MIQLQKEMWNIANEIFAKHVQHYIPHFFKKKLLMENQCLRTNYTCHCVKDTVMHL